MKKIIPVKFIIGLLIICLVIFPIGFWLVSFSLFYLLTFGNFLVPYYVIYICLFIGFIIASVYLIEPEYCKVIIEHGTISNYILDGTNNDGWCESLLNVKSVKLANKNEIQEHFQQFNKRKAILIDFGNYNIKYIYADLFSKKQINQIINILNDYIK